MPEFDIVFDKLAELLTGDDEKTISLTTTVTSSELNEIDELRRFSAEIQEPEPPSFTTT
jgi:hypothetical protein